MKQLRKEARLKLKFEEKMASLKALSTIMKDSEKIRSAVDQGTRQHKKQRTSLFPDVDKALLQWFKQARGNDVLVSGPILIEKGEQLAQKLGYTDCKLSGGWLDRFKDTESFLKPSVEKQPLQKM